MKKWLDLLTYLPTYTSKSSDISDSSDSSDSKDSSDSSESKDSSDSRDTKTQIVRKFKKIKLWPNSTFKNMVTKHKTLIVTNVENKNCEREK